MLVNHGITSSARRDHAPMARPLGPLEVDELVHWQSTGFILSETVDCLWMTLTVRSGNERTTRNRPGKLSPTRAVRGLYKLAAQRLMMYWHVLLERPLHFLILHSDVWKYQMLFAVPAECVELLAIRRKKHAKPGMEFQCCGLTEEMESGHQR
jgi:hypothetical protein